MFKTISINPPIRQGKKKINRIIDSQKVNFSFGRPEWQQKIQSTSRIFHDVKRLNDNTMILDKNYLKRNYSQVDIQNYPSDKPFMTSNMRDFKTLNLKSESEIKSEFEFVKKRMKFIRSSHIKLGEYRPEKKSMYNYNYIAPVDQKCRFNYNKINFRYNPYNIDPITQQLIWKNPKRMNGFDYFNKDKDKRYVIKRNDSFINTDYTKVYDPITNRYFPGTLRQLPNIKL